jgi:hypothetical protein
VAPRTIAPAFHTERPSLDRLPTLAVLIAPGDSGNAMPPPPDWVELEDDLHSHDPAGNWRIDPRDSHSALLTGRPGRIGIAMRGTPLPADWLQLALGRNPRLAEDTETTAELRAHSACLTLSCDLDTHAAGPDDTRQIAIAMGLTLLLLARDLHGAGRLAGLANPAHAMLFAPEQLPAFAQTLQAGDVPAPLFIGTAFHATMPGAVSLSTTGLMPFTGFEVEAWNAPGDADTIGERLASVLHHLLKQGPVLRHGDTLGRGAIRTLHGTSRAERPMPGTSLCPRCGWSSERPGPILPALWRCLRWRRLCGGRGVWKEGVVGVKEERCEGITPSRSHDVFRRSGSGARSLRPVYPPAPPKAPQASGRSACGAAKLGARPNPWRNADIKGSARAMALASSPYPPSGHSFLSRLTCGQFPRGARMG